MTYTYTFGAGEWIEWNGSATFNVYMNYENVDCFTLYSATPENWRDIASAWMLNMYENNVAK